MNVGKVLLGGGEDYLPFALSKLRYFSSLGKFPISRTIVVDDGAIILIEAWDEDNGRVTIWGGAVGLRCGTEGRVGLTGRYSGKNGFSAAMTEDANDIYTTLSPSGAAKCEWRDDRLIFTALIDGSEQVIGEVPSPMEYGYPTMMNYFGVSRRCASICSTPIAIISTGYDYGFDGVKFMGGWRCEILWPEKGDSGWKIHRELLLDSPKLFEVRAATTLNLTYPPGAESWRPADEPWPDYHVTYSDIGESVAYTDWRVSPMYVGVWKITGVWSNTSYPILDESTEPPDIMYPHGLYYKRGSDTTWGGELINVTSTTVYTDAVLSVATARGAYALFIETTGVFRPNMSVYAPWPGGIWYGEGIHWVRNYADTETSVVRLSTPAARTKPRSVTQSVLSVVGTASDPWDTVRTTTGEKARYGYMLAPDAEKGRCRVFVGKVVMPYTDEAEDQTYVYTFTMYDLVDEGGEGEDEELLLFSGTGTKDGIASVNYAIDPSYTALLVWQMAFEQRHSLERPAATGFTRKGVSVVVSIYETNTLIITSKKAAGDNAAVNRIAVALNTGEGAFLAGDTLIGGTSYNWGDNNAALAFSASKTDELHPAMAKPLPPLVFSGSGLVVNPSIKN
jgi:hypothetical protein